MNNITAKAKPRGKPFSKGADPRRGKSGSIPKAKASFKADMRRLIEEKTDAEAIYRVLVSKARAGVQWAIQELLDRGLGKPTQIVEEKRDAVVRFVFPEPNGGPGLEAGKGTAALPVASGAPAALEAEVMDEGKDCTEEELREACEKAATGGES